MSINEYLKYRNFSESFAQFYFSPRAFGCFASPKATLDGYPVASIIKFWRMHGLVGSQLSNGLIGSPTNNRRCVVGGMHKYTRLAAIYLRKQGISIMTDTSVIQVNEGDNCAYITAISRDKKIFTAEFDHIVIAAKPNQVIGILPGDHLVSQLIRIAYPTQSTRVVVHHDSRLMPANQSDWCAYNYTVFPENQEEKVGTITYWPSRIGQLELPRSDVFVSINPHREPDQYKIFADYMFIHPIFHFEDASNQQRLMRVQGIGNIWICGSFIEEPFLHEQAFVSGTNTADLLHHRVSGKRHIHNENYLSN